MLFNIIKSYLCLSLIVTCYSWKVRLVPWRNGTTVGRIEVCDDSNNTICDDSSYLRLFDNRFRTDEARVACTQMGYVGGRYYYSSLFGNGDPRTYSTTYFDCNSTVTSFSDCTTHTMGWPTRQGNRDASVQCYGESSAVVYFFGQQYLFMNGHTEGTFYGSLGIMEGGQFYYVMHDGWDDTDAAVVCRELGFSGGISFGGSKFLKVSSNSGGFLSNVECFGNETALSNCTYQKTTTYSGNNKKYAAAFCYETVPSSGFTDLRIFSSDQRTDTGKGEIQVKYKDIWGRVCDRNDALTEVTASVVCKSQGYVGGWARYDGVVGYQRRWLPYWLDNPQCTGTEPNIWNCSHNNNIEGFTRCSQYYHAANVLCYNSTEPENASTIALSNYGASSIGDNYLYLTWRGITGTITDSDWTHNDAMVACRMLSYQFGWPVFGVNRRGDARAPSDSPLAENFDCDGSESHLALCDHSQPFGVTSLTHDYDVSVWCTNTTSTDYAVRLYGDDSTSQYGAVQVYFNGLWGNICVDDEWDSTEATVVCRQLGHTYGIANPDFRGSRELGSPFWMSQVNCSGNESAVWDCGFSGWGGAQGCEMDDHEAGVLCFNQSIWVELVSGNTYSGGTVLITVDGVEGTVHDNNWDIDNVQQLCSLFGTWMGVAPRTDSAYGVGSGVVWFTNTGCTSDDTDFLNCQHSGWQQQTAQYVDHVNDAGAFCADVAQGVGETMMSAEFGSFVSYNHMADYGKQSTQMNISVTPGYRITLHFDYFQLESDSVAGSCDYNTDDVLTVHDGPYDTSPLLGTFCGHTLPGTMYSSGSHMLLSFRNDNDSDSNNNGYAAVYHQECLWTTYWESSTAVGPVSQSLKQVNVTDQLQCQIECDRYYPKCTSSLYDSDQKACYIQLESYYTMFPVNLSSINVEKATRKCNISERTDCTIGGTPGYIATSDVRSVLELPASEVSLDQCIQLCQQLGTCTFAVYNSSSCLAMYGRDFVEGDSSAFKIECHSPPEIRGNSTLSTPITEGSDFTISVQVYLGTPTAALTWRKDGQAVVSGTNYQLDTNNTWTNLTVSAASVSDEGQYTLTLTNIKGTVQFSFNVTILVITTTEILTTTNEETTTTEYATTTAEQTTTEYTTTTEQPTTTQQPTTMQQSTTEKSTTMQQTTATEQPTSTEETTELAASTEQITKLEYLSQTTPVSGFEANTDELNADALGQTIDDVTSPSTATVIGIAIASLVTIAAVTVVTVILIKGKLASAGTGSQKVAAFNATENNLSSLPNSVPPPKQNYVPSFTGHR